MPLPTGHHPWDENARTLPAPAVTISTPRREPSGLAVQALMPKGIDRVREWVERQGLDVGKPVPGRVMDQIAVALNMHPRQVLRRIEELRCEPKERPMENGRRVMPQDLSPRERQLWGELEKRGRDPLEKMTQALALEIAGGWGVKSESNLFCYHRNILVKAERDRKNGTAPPPAETHATPPQEPASSAADADAADVPTPAEAPQDEPDVDELEAACEELELRATILRVKKALTAASPEDADLPLEDQVANLAQQRDALLAAQREASIEERDLRRDLEGATAEAEDARRERDQARDESARLCAENAELLEQLDRLREEERKHMAACPLMQAAAPVPVEVPRAEAQVIRVQIVDTEPLTDAERLRALLLTLDAVQDEVPLGRAARILQCAADMAAIGARS